MKPQRPNGFSPDMQMLLFTEPTTAPRDIGVVRLPERTSDLLISTPFDEVNAEVSPDGRWLAYQSNESGGFEIYVRPWPDVGAGRWQISNGGGTRPLWARNGRELFYYVSGGTVMAVPVQPGGAPIAGAPQKIFQHREAVEAVTPVTGRHYDVSSDGRRFLMIKRGTGETPPPPQIVVVQNWFEELKRLVPVN